MENTNYSIEYMIQKATSIHLMVANVSLNLMISDRLNTNKME